MTWFGTASAWAAAAIGAAFAFSAAVQISDGVVPWLTMLGAALLVTGAFRVLRKKSGGLRLLCGAWGFAAALMFGAARTMSVAENTPDTLIAPVLLIAPFVALIGLALTVLHKETK